MKKRGKFLLLVVLTLLLFLNQAKSDKVTTIAEINYNNTAPILIQNIPDQYLAINLSKLDAFDLDNYFIDNETLSYTVNYLGARNVTITINSENFVSLYPETNWNGSINVTFIAYDGITTTESNVVQIFVIEDTQPPQWSNPAIFHTGTKIYQNSYVNFSTTWTDDFGLNSFIFMINQGSGWTTYPAQSMVGVQNISKTRVQISSSGGLVYWKIGAYDHSGNYNETNIQNITVEITPSPPAGGESIAERGEPRYGEGFAPAFSPKTTEQITDFTVSPGSFNIELKQDHSIILSIKITNTGTKNLSFNAYTLGLGMIEKSLSENEFGLNPGESKVINLLLSASKTTPVEIYYGKIIITTNENTKEVPIAVAIKPIITDLDIKIKVLEKYKQVRPGNSVIANITLENLAEIETKTITLYYAITDFVGNILDSNTENFNFSEKSTQLERKLMVPQNAPRGEYIYFARATSENDTTLASDTFFVGSRFTLMGFIRANLLILLIIIASIVVALLMVKYHQNQERLRLLNLYLMITNLKKLLKEGNLDEAIKLYIRIKASYGQPLSRSAIQNREELKKEIEKLTDKLHSSEALEKVEETEKEKTLTKTSGQSEKKEQNKQNDLKESAEKSKQTEEQKKEELSKPENEKEENKK